MGRRLALAIAATLGIGCGGASHATANADGAASPDAAGGDIAAADVPSDRDGGSGRDDAGADADAENAISPRRGRIAVGDGFACAIDEAGTPRCWGGGVVASTPVGTGFTYIAAGPAGACALDANGAVVCWTMSNTGSSAIDTDVPPPPFTEVTVGGDRFSEFACAIRANGQTVCWRDTDVTPMPSLTTPPAGVSFTRLAAGVSHTCGLQPSGAPSCWGTPGAAALAGIPAQPFVDIVSGVLFSCALGAAGQPACWGTTFYATEFPASVSAVALAAARSSLNPIVCALRPTGKVLCSSASAPYPGPPDLAARFDEIAVGSRHVCGVTLERSVVCWSAEMHAAGDVRDIPNGLLVPAR